MLLHKVYFIQEVARLRKRQGKETGERVGVKSLRLKMLTNGKRVMWQFAGKVFYSVQWHSQNLNESAEEPRKKYPGL